MAEQAFAAHGNLISSERVEGTAVYNDQGEHLGKISNFLIDKVTGQVRYAVMSFGGFLGIGNDHYPVPWSMLHYDTSKSGYRVNLSKDVLENAPHYTSDLRPDHDEEYARSIYQYYGLMYP